VPYPTFHKAKNLADRLGAIPTIQTVKNLEEVIKLDERRKQQENAKADKRFAKIQRRAEKKRREQEESDSDGNADYPRIRLVQICLAWIALPLVIGYRAPSVYCGEGTVTLMFSHHLHCLQVQAHYLY